LPADRGHGLRNAKRYEAIAASVAGMFEDVKRGSRQHPIQPGFIARHCASPGKMALTSP